MICPNCGKELAEGEVCTCTATVENENKAEAAPAAEPVPVAIPVAPPQPEQQQYQQPQGEYYISPQGQGTYYQPGAAQPQYYQPVQIPPARTDYPEGYKIKRKYAAVILAATLGVFGIHNFYLGDSNKAIIHILVATLGSLLAGLGFIASYIWAVVEAVQLLTDSIDRDSNGYKIQTFEEALVKTRMEAEAKNKE
ncbi:MAG: TM2 domain-containing protein [Eubacterium sp.]|nr:TM2 domain-containing protein [Eubacterium sp.]